MRSTAYSLPNLLTYARIVCVPLVVLCFFLEGSLRSPDYARWTSLVIFVIASITDYFDGYLARAWKQTSTIGRMLDPIADLDAKPRRRAAIQFEDVTDRLFRRDDIARQGLCIASDGSDRSVLADEQHVERDKRVLHPHGDHAGLVEDEQHAVIGGHLLTEHQARATCLVGIGDLDRDRHRAFRRHDPKIVGGVRLEGEIGDQREDRREAEEGFGDEAFRHDRRSLFSGASDDWHASPGWS